MFTSTFQVVYFLRAFPPKPCTLFCPPPCVPHALPTSFLICLIIFGEEYKISSSLCNFLHSHVTSSVFGPNILFRSTYIKYIILLDISWVVQHGLWILIALMMEAARTSETSVDNYSTWQYIPEDKSELDTSHPFFSALCVTHVTPSHIFLKW
jgi:hypothetical protein